MRVHHLENVDAEGKTVITKAFIAHNANKIVFNKFTIICCRRTLFTFRLLVALQEDDLIWLAEENLWWWKKQ